MGNKKNKFDENDDSVLEITQNADLFKLTERNKKTKAEKKIIVHKGGTLAEFKKRCEHCKYPAQD